MLSCRMNRIHARGHEWTFHWPVPPLNIALVEPEIPPNTGNIARLCAATGSRLHLVGKLGFRLTDSRVRRAGLDYWDSVDITRHESIPAFHAAVPGRRFYFSTTGVTAYTQVRYEAGDSLVFGSESAGLPMDILAENAAYVVGIPIRHNHVRSLNLATSVAIALYEALRQIDALPVQAALDATGRRDCAGSRTEYVKGPSGV